MDEKVNMIQPLCATNNGKAEEIGKDIKLSQTDFMSKN